MVILIITDLENVIHEVIDPGVEQQRVGHVPLVGDTKPELEVLLLMLEGLFVDFNTSFEANGVYLLLGVLVQGNERK